MFVKVGFSRVLVRGSRRFGEEGRNLTLLVDERRSAVARTTCRCHCKFAIVETAERQSQRLRQWRFFCPTKMRGGMNDYDL